MNQRLIYVVTGPQGSGKTSVGLQLLRGQPGPQVLQAIPLRALSNGFSLGDVLRHAPAGLLVECDAPVLSVNEALAENLREFLHDTIQCHRRGVEPVLVRTPALVLTATKLKLDTGLNFPELREVRLIV